MRRSLLPLVLLLLAALTAPAQAGSLEDDLATVGQKIDAFKADLDDARGDRTEVAEQVLSASARLDQLVADLTGARNDLAGVQGDIDTTAAQIDDLRAQLQAQYEVLETTRLTLRDTRAKAKVRAQSLYMRGGRSLNSFVFAAGEVVDVTLGIEYAAAVLDTTDRIINDLSALESEEDNQAVKIADREQELVDEVAKLEDRRLRLEDLASTVEARSDQVREVLDAQQALLDEIEHEIEHFNSELQALEREQDRIEALIKERQRQDEGGGSAPGILVRPVPGAITSPFGWRVHPIYGTRRLHTGIDMTASYGTPIRSGASGTVILATYYGGYGNTVIVDHGGGLSTLYAHQSRLAVSRGESVDAGETIGYVGSTGLSTGPHLHFEVRTWGTPIDPKPYL